MQGDSDGTWTPRIIEGGADSLSSDEIFLLAATAITAESVNLSHIFSENDAEPESNVVDFSYERIRAKILSGEISAAQELYAHWMGDVYDDDGMLKRFARHLVLRISNNDVYRMEGTSGQMPWVELLRRIVQFLDPHSKFGPIIRQMAADESDPALSVAAKETIEKLTDTNKK